jgi:uncharacterized protein YggE
MEKQPVKSPRQVKSPKQEETKPMSPYELRTQTQQNRSVEGITVTGEAVRRVAPESAEFLVEIMTAAPTAAQALRENHQRTMHLAQAVAPLGVQASDLQTVSFNAYSQFAPVVPGLSSLLPGYGAPQQIGQPGFSPYGGAVHSGTGVQSEIQFGSFHARNTVRVNVREPGRAGDIMDAVTKAGANIVGGFSLKASDEGQARRGALEAAGRDARAKAEALAVAAGKQLGDVVGVCEEIVATNGTYAALRAALPFSFGAGAPQIAGELEYYARVSANFRLV